MGNEERAWAAGFFDGEGHVSCIAYGKPRMDGTRHWRLTMSVTQAVSPLRQGAPHVLVRFQAAMDGCGRIYRSERAHITNPNARPQYQWMTTRSDQCLAIMWWLWPWLSDDKRADAEHALERYAAGQAKLIRGKVCPRGHVLTPDNCIPRKDGRRYCRICREALRARYEAEGKHIYGT